MFQSNIDNAAQLLNQKQTAAALGLSAGRLSQLKKEGRITYADPVRKLYDVEQVRAQWERTADVRQSVATETRRLVRESGADVVPAQEAVFATTDLGAELDEDEPEYGPDHHENYKIAASFEKRDAARIARIVRDTLLGALPAKLAPALAAITDVFELEQALREALRLALHDIVRKVEAVHVAG